jgi:ATP:cob(I)alamin adenosyltransferase
MARVHLGDEGFTSVIGKKVKKTNKQIRALNALDELTAWIEFCNSYLNSKVLTKTIQDLYKISVNVAGGNVKITKKDVEFIEKESLKIDSKIKIKKFVVFKGRSAFTNIARTVCSRTEIELLNYSKPSINSIYLNRLSTLLFSLSVKEFTNHNTQILSRKKL